MTWKRDLATWSLGAVVSMTLTLAIPGAAVGSPTPLKPAVATAAYGEAFPLIAKGDKKDKGKSPGKSDRGSSSSKSKSKSSGDSKAKQRDNDRQRADDARRREAARQKTREDAKRREDARRKADDAKRREDARRQEDARRRAAQLREREDARRRADEAQRREQARQRGDESRRREDARRRADELRRRIENQRRADDARRGESQRPTRPTVRPRTEPQRTPPDTRSRTTPDRRSNDPPRFGRDRDRGSLGRRLPPSEAPRTTPRRGPDIITMPPGTRPDSPGIRDVLRDRPGRWSDPGGTASRRTPTIAPDGRGSVLPRITPDRTPVLHGNDPPGLSRPPRVPVGSKSSPGDSFDPFRPDLPGVWSRFDGDHGGGGGGGHGGGGGGGGGGGNHGGGHHQPPEIVIENTIFNYGHDYHHDYNSLYCGYDYWDHWRWGRRGWHGWNWWYCDGWDGWSFWFGFWGGHSCRWWFSFSFNFGDDWYGYCRPWRHYTMRYDGCHVRYHRPWRGWFRRHYLPRRFVVSCWPWQYNAYRYYDWYAPGPDWYVSYRSSTPIYYIVQTPAEPALPSIDDAWSLLRSGDLETARSLFSDLVYALPYEGEARIGYAIASGLLYRDDAAVSAMRRALRDEPSALRAVPRDSIMRRQFSGLLDFYADRARRNFGDLDALFMVAALRYLLDEPSVAYFAADAAIRSGDDDEATYNLKLLIEESMYESF